MPVENSAECSKHATYSRTKYDAVLVGAGATSAAALAAIGQYGIKKVLILDAGSEDVVPETSQGKSSAENSSPGKKSWRGSYAPYEVSAFEADYLLENVYAQPSRYFGGFSRVWGATVSFYDNLQRIGNAAEISSGDISVVENLLCPSVTTFNISVNNSGTIAGSSASGRVFNRLVDLGSSSWKVEPSKLAINTKGGGFSCTLNGTCIQGCSKDSIWFAGNSIIELMRIHGFDLGRGLLVKSVGEANGLPFVDTRCSFCDAIFRVTAERVFIAAGPIGTGIILLNSGISDEVEIRDTATAFGVAFSFRWARFGKGHNLSQFWITDLRSDSVAAQVYPPSQVFAGRIAERLPKARIFRWLASLVSHFVHPVIFYNTSHESEKLILRTIDGKARVSGSNSPENNKKFVFRVKEVGRFLLKAGLFLPIPLIELTPPGTGFHSGSSIPQGTKTDFLGRLPNFQKIHFVDSSVLPEILVGSITPTVMANAARIIRLIYS